jgi:tetratricopeptide (TPR) repeat protein
LAAMALASAAVLCPVGACASTDDPAAHYQTLLKARAANAAGQYDTAAALYGQAAEEDPQNGSLELRRAHALQNLKRYPEALAAYLAADAREGGLASYDAMRVAQLYALVGDRTNALAWLRTALERRLDGRTALLDNPAFAAWREDPEFRKLVGAPPTRPMSRAERWRFDLNLLLEEAQRLHASPGRPAFQPAFEREVARLSDNVDSLSDDALELGVRHLVASLGDGHSNVMFPNQRMVQADLWTFSDGLFVLGGEGEAAAASGARVVAIGGRPIERLLAALRPYQSADNAATQAWTERVAVLETRFLSSQGALRADAAQAVMTVRDSSGRERDIRVPVGQTFREQKLGAQPAGKGVVPLWLREPDRNFRLEPLPALNAVYLGFNQVFDDRAHNETLSGLAGRLDAALASSGARNLIVDVRRNNGGNGNAVWPLLVEMAHFKQSGGEVFLITGHGTFSAAQIFIARAEVMMHPVFVGESSSSSPDFTGEDGERLVLPFSGIRVNISFRWHQAQLSDDRRPSIDVDVPAPLSSADYFGGRDPAMEAIAAIITHAPTAPRP